jgi:peptidyl-prolyl cis-trans isomerase D
MLQNIRDNSQGWIAKSIIGLIVVLLALTGFEAIFQSTSNSQNAAEVNGEVISLNDLARASDMQRRQLQQRLGQDFDASLLDDKLLNSAALKGLIDQKLLLQGSTEAGFAFSEQALDQMILQEPQFQVDGRFNADRFDMLVRQMGYSRPQFREMLRNEMLTAQLRAGIVASSFVTDAEVMAFARLEQQKRDFATLLIPADANAIVVSDEDIQNYFSENTERFMTPEQVRLEYVELKKESFFDQVEVTDEELQALYETEIENLAEQRQAAHILIEVNDQVSDEQAQARLVEIQARLAAGEDFAALAKEFSDDPGSAVSGGDLGFAGPGVYDPAFEEALYALQQDQVSAAVRSEFGWHLIKLLGVQGAEIPDFESLREKLTRDIKAQKVEQLFVETSRQLEDLSFEASDLAQPAQELGLQVSTSQLFGREGGEGLLANRQVLQAAFSPEVLEDGANSQLLELDPTTVVVLRVKEHLQPRPMPLEEVAEQVRTTLQVERARAAAQAAGEELLAALREGKTPATQNSQQTWVVTEAAGRAQEGADPQILQAVFRMQRPPSADQPSFAGIALANGDFVVLRLNGVSEKSEALSAEDLATYRNYLASRAGEQDFSAYRSQLEQTADIQRF